MEPLPIARCFCRALKTNEKLKPDAVLISDCVWDRIVGIESLPMHSLNINIYRDSSSAPIRSLAPKTQLI